MSSFHALKDELSGGPIDRIAECPVDPLWVQYGDKYYGVSSGRHNFTGAASYCESRGGKLASISTEKEFGAVSAILGKS